MFSHLLTERELDNNKFFVLSKIAEATSETDCEATFNIKDIFIENHRDNRDIFKQWLLKQCDIEDVVVIGKGLFKINVNDEFLQLYKNKTNGGNIL